MEAAPGPSQPAKALVAANQANVTDWAASPSAHHLKTLLHLHWSPNRGTRTPCLRQPGWGTPKPPTCSEAASPGIATPPPCYLCPFGIWPCSSVPPQGDNWRCHRWARVPSHSLCVLCPTPKLHVQNQSCLVSPPCLHLLPRQGPKSRLCCHQVPVIRPTGARGPGEKTGPAQTLSAGQLGWSLLTGRVRQ